MLRFFFFITILLPCAWAEQIVIVSFGLDKKLFVYSLNSKNGTLQMRSIFPLASGAGPMCVNRAGTRLYVGMKGTGKLAAFQINHDVSLTLLGETEIGADASFLTLHPDEKFLLTSYYKAGKVAVHGILRNGSLSKIPTQMVKTDERAHCITCDPTGTFVFVPHTRPNTIHQFRFNSKTGTLTPIDPAKLQREDNSGPRHLWFHQKNGHAYGSDEQGRAAATYRFDPKSGVLRFVETIPTPPPVGYVGKHSTSDIEVHPSGDFVYLANRGHNVIVPFKIDPRSAKLSVLPQVPTEEVTRSFNISPDGKMLVAAGQKSGNLATFAIGKNGNLKRLATKQAGTNPWWVEVVNAPRGSSRR